MSLLRIFLLIFPAFFLALPEAAEAAAAAGNAAAEHAPDWMNLLYRVLNLVLVVGVIWFLAGKQIGAFFSGRRTGIDQELKDLEARKLKAREDLLEVERRIASLAAEREAVFAEYRARGEALKQEIISQAEARAERILSQARIGAQTEVDQAMLRMRAELAEAIALATRDALEKELTPGQHDALIDSFLNKVVMQ